MTKNQGLYNFIIQEKLYAYLGENGQIVKYDDKYGKYITVNRIVKAPAKNRERIEKIGLLLTQDCNLKCKYCYAEEGQYHSPGKMERKTAIRCIENTLNKNKNQPLEVVFFGGEPIINYDVIRQIVLYFESKTDKLTYSITTNGTLITNSITDFLLKHNINVLISLDGNYSNNKNRIYKDGSSTYYDVINNTQRLREYSNIGIRATLMPNNMDIVETAKHMIDIGFSYFTIEPAFDFFEESKFEEMISRYKEYFEYLEKQIQEKRYDFVRRNYTFFKMIQRIHYSKQRDSYCNMGKTICAFDIEGKSSPCHRFVELQNLEKTYISSEMIYEQLRKYKQTICKNCYAYNFCNLGCPYEFYSNQNNPQKLEFYCRYAKRNLEILLKIYVQLTEEDKKYLFGRHENE